MGARVLLATGCSILGDGLEQPLLAHPGIRSVAVATSGTEALDRLTRTPIDVAVLDVELPDLSAVAVIEHTRSRGSSTRCIALVGEPTRAEVDRIMRAGAAGISSTRCSVGMLVEAVRRVHAGNSYVSADITHALVSGLAGDRIGGSMMTPGQELHALTVREREVLRLIAADCSSGEIARKLGVSIRTVETHRSNLMEKLDLRKTAVLVRFAVRQGLVTA